MSLRLFKSSLLSSCLPLCLYLSIRLSFQGSNSSHTFYKGPTCKSSTFVTFVLTTSHYMAQVKQHQATRSDHPPQNSLNHGEFPQNSRWPSRYTATFWKAAVCAVGCKHNCTKNSLDRTTLKLDVLSLSTTILSFKPKLVRNENTSTCSNQSEVVWVRLPLQFLPDRCISGRVTCSLKPKCFLTRQDGINGHDQLVINPRSVLSHFMIETDDLYSVNVHKHVKFGLWIRVKHVPFIFADQSNWPYSLQLSSET